MVTVGIKVGMMFVYGDSFVCGLCGIFYPAPQSMYADVVFALIYVFLFAICMTEFPFFIRKTVKKWLIFLTANLFIQSLSTFIMVQNLDFGFCTNTLCVWISSIFYAPLIFNVFVEDTNAVISKNIDEGVLDNETDPILYYGSKIKEEKNSISLLKFSDLKFGPKIGVGGYGEVSLGRWQHTDVAIKRIFQKSAEQEVDNFLREIKLMSKLSHPNILLFIGACITSTDEEEVK
jgi:hypothetical protein